MFIFMAKNKRNGIKDFTKLVIPRYVIFGDFEIHDQAKYRKKQLRMYFETPSH